MAATPPSARADSVQVAEAAGIAGDAEVRRRVRAKLARLGLVLGSLLAAMLFWEAALRMLPGQSLAPVEDEKSLTYRHDPEFGWFPIANSSKRVNGSRTITATHNREGFRGGEFPLDQKPGIVFLGDSLVWGFDVEASERFTDLLQARHTEWNVYNLGVSGYGTDQENLVLHRFFDRIRPRVVFLVICGDNDNDDNASNCRGGYYKPWYTIEAGKLSLHGVPVPKSEQVIFAEHKLLCSSYVTRLLVRAYCKWRLPAPSRTAEPPTGAILLDMQAFLTSHGAAFEVGLQHPHPEMETFLARYQIPFVILETTNAGDLYQEHGNHWTPQGHMSVAAKIDEFLRN